MDMRMGYGRKVLGGVTGIGIVLAVLLGVVRPKPPVPDAPRVREVVVAAIRVEPRERDDVTLLPGRVEAWSDVWVAVEQAGRVTAIHVDEGDEVAPGAPLLGVDDRLWKTALERAAVLADDARRDHERLSELHATGAVSASDLEALESRARLAEIALAEARVQVERCVPAAPIAGIVDRRRVSVGEYVHAGHPVFRIIDARRVKIRCQVPERGIHTVRPGTTHRFRVDAVPAKDFQGTVRTVAQAADHGSSTFTVELAADNPTGALRPGMIAKIELLRGRLSAAVILPAEAVVPFKGETVVFLVEDGRAVRRIVRLAGFLDADVAIADGVRPGEVVILDGNRAVLDGTPVRIERVVN